MYTEYTVSENNSVYILRFLRNWGMQSYSVTITGSIVASLNPNGLLTAKGYKCFNKIHIKCYFVELKTHFSQGLLFIGRDIFPQVMVIFLLLIKHVPLGFNALVAPTVCILREKLWKVVRKCKIAMFLYFVPFFWKFIFLRLWYFISC